ncbi:PAS domain-containing sensor histidine kinase [Psychroserpens burtonensis]|uniref:PAS domain-containing sensor histidine kinase n=1 Tax=Psychroserpens burtonensis TaxID=49278 RepID=UPI00040F473D|nr:PAS domain S-box protein [Psychroserpens burtonensis]
MSQEQLDILKRALKREKSARKAAETILEEKSRELYKTSQRLEHLLDEKSSQLQGIFENIVDAYVVMDIYGNVLKFNEAATKLFGYDIDKEAVNVVDLIYKEDYQYAMLSYMDLQTKGFFKDYEARVHTKFGQVRWVHINASIILDKNKKPIAAQGIVRDITDQKASEEKLIKSESRLSSLILNLDTGVLLEDEDRKIVLTNKKFCELLHIPLDPESLKGQDCTNASNQSKVLFENEDGFVSRIEYVLKNKKTVLSDELVMKNGAVLERDFVPIIKDDIYRGHLWAYRDVTLNRTYSKRLEAQKQKYSNIIANMNLGMVEVNNEDEILMINQSFSEMSGYTETELLGKKGVDVFLVDKFKDIIYKENSKGQNDESNSYELEIKTKSGETRHWFISGAPNYDVNGNVTGSIGIHLDITDDKRNTELIEDQKRELDVIVNSSPIGIVLTQYGQIIKTNSTFQEMLGYAENQLNALTIKELSLPEDYPDSKVFIDKINTGEIDNFTINKRYKKIDGSVIWAKTNVNAVRDIHGNIKYQVALIEDITSEREKTLIIDLINNLTKSILGKIDINEIARQIVNNIAHYLDSEDCVIYLINHDNETLEQVAVYGEKLDEDNKIRKRLIVPIGEGIVGNVVKTATSKLIKDTSEEYIYIAGDKRRFSQIAVPIISSGRVIGVIDSKHKDENYYTQEHVKALESIASLVAIKLRTALNIRERKKAEAKNEDLRIELEKSNDELQEYAHIVSHDLKSPLRSISALVSWIKEDNSGKFDKTSLLNFDLIGTTLDRMELLISDILTYSSIGSETLIDQEVDLNLLVDDLKQILYVPEHITITILNTLPTIKGDKTKLQQLYQNLLSNAIKFNDKEQGLIEINVEEKRSFYLFSIKDNGVGIDKKYHDKIFKIFHSLNKSKESTGIGLSIVKKIVNLHDGEIWLTSKVNEGTTFYFTLKK